MTAKAASGSQRSRPARGRLYFSPGQRAEPQEQNQPQQNRHSVGDAVQKSLGRAGNQRLSGGKFERQPEQQDGREVRQTRLVACLAAPDYRGHGRRGIGQHRCCQSQAECPGQHRSQAENRRQEKGHGPEQRGLSMEQFPHPALGRRHEETEYRCQQQRKKQRVHR